MAQGGFATPDHATGIHLQGAQSPLPAAAGFATLDHVIGFHIQGAVPAGPTFPLAGFATPDHLAGIHIQGALPSEPPPPPDLAVGYPRQRKRRWILPDGRRFYGTLDQLLAWWAINYPAQTPVEATEQRRSQTLLRDRLRMLGIAWRERMGREERDGEVEIDLSNVPGLAPTPDLMAGAGPKPRSLTNEDIAAAFAGIRFRRADLRRERLESARNEAVDVTQSKNAVSDYLKREKRAITQAIEDDRRAVAAMKPPLKSFEDRMWRDILRRGGEDLIDLSDELRRLRRRRRR